MVFAPQEAKQMKRRKGVGHRPLALLEREKTATIRPTRKRTKGEVLPDNVLRKKVEGYYSLGRSPRLFITFKEKGIHEREGGGGGKKGRRCLSSKKRDRLDRRRRLFPSEEPSGERGEGPHYPRRLRDEKKKENRSSILDYRRGGEGREGEVRPLIA